MDGGDVSLAIRRARRSGAQSLDLSHRGLSAWPDGLSALRHLESLDLSGNNLTSVDLGLGKLEKLEELNLANNKLDSLSALEPLNLPRLRSISLEGNPLVSHVASSMIRQLAQPPPTPGKTPAEVIATVLAHASSCSPSPHPFAVEPAPAAADEVTAFGVFESEPPAASQDSRNQKPEVDWLLKGEGDGGQPWRKDQCAMLKEIEQLQARVQELELAAKAAPSQGGRGDSSATLPAWLRGEPGHGQHSRTLPSRHPTVDDDAQASEAKAQLRDEQRKCKRLEKEVQRLSERHNERDMLRGGVGSIPHFDFAEVELGEIMAQGGFSVVHKGYWHTTKVAVKKLFDPKIDEGLLAEFDNEVQKLEQLRHPNILLLLAVHRKPPALSMIFEFVEGGSLYQLLHTPSKFNGPQGPLTGISPAQVMEIMEYCGAAIAFLHARGMVHRDVKSQNVLLSPNFEVKLCDFGLARMKSELMTGAMQFAGTPNYMAPEIFRNQKYTESVDVFAFGTMLWEATAVDIPWANFDPADIRDRVVAGQELPVLTLTPSAVRALIVACRAVDQRARPAMAEVVSRLREGPRDAAAVPRARPRTAGLGHSGAPATGLSGVGA